MKDRHSCQNCEAHESTTPSVLCYLNPTVRLIHYDSLFNSRQKTAIKIRDVGARQIAELERDKDYIYTLKFRPFAQNYAQFGPTELKQSLLANQAPYLERDDSPTTETIPTVNAQTLNLKAADVTLVIVSAS